MRRTSRVLSILSVATLAASASLISLSDWTGASENVQLAHVVGPSTATCPTPTGRGAGAITLAPDARLPTARLAAVPAAAPTSATQFAHDVLNEIAVPPHGAPSTIAKGSILATAFATPYIAGLTDVHKAFKVPLGLAAAESYETHHLARGAKVVSKGANCVAGKTVLTLLESVLLSGNHEYSAQIAVGLMSLSAHSTLLRGDAEVSWVPTRSTSERAPAGAPLSLTVYGGGPAGGGTTTTGVTGSDQIAVTSMLNKLPLAPSVQCAESAPMYQLQWGAGVSSFVATGYSCGGMVSVSSDGKAAARLLDHGDRIVSLLNGFHLPVPPISYAGNSTNWAGWESAPLSSRAFQSVFAQWTVPKASCGFGELSAAVQWVGIDGDTALGSSTVEQDGTMTYCIVGQGTYYPWWELFGSTLNGGAMVLIGGNDHIKPGDVVDVQVVAGQGSGGGSTVTWPPSYPASGQFLFDIVNLTEHWEWFQIEGPFSPSPLGQTAEWIAEEPSCPDILCGSLSNYGSVTFSQMSFANNQFAYPFGAISPPGSTSGMVLNQVVGGTTKQVGSPLVGGNKETVTWLHH